jgi:hypothetical protein
VIHLGAVLLAGVAVVIMALSPLPSLVAIPVFTTWGARGRAVIVRRQIEPTDAIDRELGARVAPVVRRPYYGPWQIRIAGPFPRRAVGPRVLDIVLAALERMPGRYEVVLTGGDGSGWPIFASWRPLSTRWPLAKRRVGRDQSLAWGLPHGQTTVTFPRSTRGGRDRHGASIG